MMKSVALMECTPVTAVRDQRVEVEFVEWTGGGRLRHASFRQLALRRSKKV